MKKKKEKYTLKEYIEYRWKIRHHKTDYLYNKDHPLRKVTKTIWFKIEIVVGRFLMFSVYSILCILLLKLHIGGICNQYTRIKIMKDLGVAEGKILKKDKNTYIHRYGRHTSRMRIIYYSYIVNDSVYSGSESFFDKDTRYIYEGQQVLINYEKGNPSNSMISENQFD